MTRTPNYLFTVPMAEGKSQDASVDTLRSMIRKVNKIGHMSNHLALELMQLNPALAKIIIDRFMDGRKLEMKLRGRLGKNNPNADRYRANHQQIIKLQDAVRADVYLYNR